MIRVPFDPTISAQQELRITLAQPVILTLHWNTVSGFWFMDLENVAGTKKLTSLKVVPPLPLLYNFKALAPIDGDFMVVRKDEGAPEKIGFYDLGVRWALVYMTAEEVAAWKVQNDLA